MKKSPQWEMVVEEHGVGGHVVSETMRLDVGTGWLYRTELVHSTPAVAMVYVPHKTET